MNENKGKIILEEKKEAPKEEKKKTNDEMRKKLLRMIVIISIVMVVFMIILFVSTLFIGKNLSYEKIEVELKNAAMEYYKVQDVLLPEKEGEKTEVDAETLSSEEYKLMKPLSKLRSKDSCTGKVVVQKINDQFIYTPYLDCGEAYATQELYQRVLDQKTTTSGSGLYDMNGEYVYRGENVNNYVQLDKNIFQIVKITSDKKILLIASINNNITKIWDDRYNPERRYNSGFNTYNVSRMKEFLTTYYDNGVDKNIFLSESDKEKLTTFSLCTGRRSKTEANNTGEVECIEQQEGAMIGLLTASDYMRASLDTNCKTTMDKACQNYNYLKEKNADWWLLTGNSENSYEVYCVKKSGYIDKANASSGMIVRPVVMLNNNVMVKSGEGTLKKPYILK